MSATRWLLVHETFVDVCPGRPRPSLTQAAWLAARGCQVVEALLAQVSTKHVESAVARSIGMDAGTLETHLRRIRAKDVHVGRPTLTRPASARARGRPLPPPRC